MFSKAVRVAIPAAVAAGCAVLMLHRKKKPSAGDVGQKGDRKDGKKSNNKVYAPQAPREGIYSFISGFKDAKTVEMHFSFDSDHFSFHVAEDEFLVESGDSHVGILNGELFHMQFEYASYYAGEDFGKLRQELSEKHTDLAEAVLGENAGVRFLEGDSLCFVFPIPEDRYSYLQVTVLKDAENDDELSELPEYPDLKYIFGSISFSEI